MSWFTEYIKKDKNNLNNISLILAGVLYSLIKQLNTKVFNDYQEKVKIYKEIERKIRTFSDVHDLGLDDFNIGILTHDVFEKEIDFETLKQIIYNNLKFLYLIQSGQDYDKNDLI